MLCFHIEKLMHKAGSFSEKSTSISDRLMSKGCLGNWCENMHLYIQWQLHQSSCMRHEASTDEHRLVRDSSSMVRLFVRPSHVYRCLDTHSRSTTPGPGCVRQSRAPGLRSGFVGRPAGSTKPWDATPTMGRVVSYVLASVAAAA